MSRDIVKLIALFFIASTIGCSIGPYEELEEASVPEGPGVFTGDSGEFSYKAFVGKKEKAQREVDSGNTVSSSSGDIVVPSVGEDSFRDFEEFKAWRRAQEPGSENYQEYQDWRAYQQYLRFKEQQPQNKTNASP